MNRFLVHPFVWREDIRTNQAVVFTRPQSIGVLGGFEKRTFRDRRVQLRQLSSSSTSCISPDRIKGFVVRIQVIQS